MPIDPQVTARRDASAFGFALLLNLVWINASEVFRYFLIVTPMLRESLPQQPGVAPMSVPIFMIWALWDTILVVAVTSIAWLILERFGPTMRNVLLAGTALWLTIFVIFWLAVVNMGLAPMQAPLAALPLAWLEMVVASQIVAWSMRRGSNAVGASRLEAPQRTA